MFALYVNFSSYRPMPQMQESEEDTFLAVAPSLLDTTVAPSREAYVPTT